MGRKRVSETAIDVFEQDLGFAAFFAQQRISLSIRDQLRTIIDNLHITQIALAADIGVDTAKLRAWLKDPLGKYSDLGPYMDIYLRTHGLLNLKRAIYRKYQQIQSPTASLRIPNTDASIVPSIPSIQPTNGGTEDDFEPPAKRPHRTRSTGSSSVISAENSATNSAASAIVALPPEPISAKRSIPNAENGGDDVVCKTSRSSSDAIDEEAQSPVARCTGPIPEHTDEQTACHDIAEQTESGQQTARGLDAEPPDASLTAELMDIAESTAGSEPAAISISEKQSAGAIAATTTAAATTSGTDTTSSTTVPSNPTADVTATTRSIASLLSAGVPIHMLHLFTSSPGYRSAAGAALNPFAITSAAAAVRVSTPPKPSVVATSAAHRPPAHTAATTVHSANSVNAAVSTTSIQHTGSANAAASAASTATSSGVHVAPVFDSTGEPELVVSLRSPIVPQSTIFCQITGKPAREPVRNPRCQHIYELAKVMAVIEQNKHKLRVACPISKCDQRIKSDELIRVPKPMATRNVITNTDELELCAEPIAIRCPITKRLFEKPYRSTLCGHVFEHTAVDAYMRACKQPQHGIPCPVAGCANSISAEVLTPAPDVLAEMKRQRDEMQLQNSDSDAGSDGDAMYASARHNGAVRTTATAASAGAVLNGPSSLDFIAAAKVGLDPTTADNVVQSVPKQSPKRRRRRIRGTVVSAAAPTNTSAVASAAVVLPATSTGSNKLAAGRRQSAFESDDDDDELQFVSVTVGKGRTNASMPRNPQSEVIILD
eukprot:TRINITY_DN8403_c0_g1_i1.p1 TRINITY_DN8403_c0_g1~~TRINITY_DN8403_c0_g1_i1.p1  ORF type:complete len:774 (-),score=177.91 TRINITY_DN8403_c0_g1_i1:481-2802(-)